MSLLKTQNLNVFYGDLQALFDIEVRVEAGELTTIVGANASGKSTLINTLSGILIQRSGTIAFEDRRIELLPPHRRVDAGSFKSRRAASSSRTCPWKKTSKWALIPPRHGFTVGRIWKRCIPCCPA